MLKRSVLFLVYLCVHVRGSEEISFENLVWTLGSSVNTSVGPEDALYCKLNNAGGYTVFDGFGPCQITVDRVSPEHAGRWIISIGFPGSVVVQTYSFDVDVQAGSVSTPLVTTFVSTGEPTVLMTCSVPAEYEVQACRFRNPEGQIYVASGQDGSVFYSADNDELAIQNNTCAFRLAGPKSVDLGLWRCGVVTDRDTYYAFLNVAVVPIWPTLTAHRHFISVKENEPLQISCSINSAIRYCYFRDRNGTVYSVGPSTSSPDYEYVGNGFDSGECGIRFSGVSTSLSGDWSCHVGFVDPILAEQRDSFTVQITEWLTVAQFWHGSEVAVRGQIDKFLPAEYCRFVRIDGYGFTTQNAPPGYDTDPWLQTGRCMMYIKNPYILDMYPWTIGIKLIGHNGEFTKSTIDTPLVFPPLNNGIPSITLGCAIFLWVLLAVVVVLLIAGGVALIPKKNREWTYARASHLRNSLRKQPLPTHVNGPTSPPTA